MEKNTEVYFAQMIPKGDWEAVIVEPKRVVGEDTNTRKKDIETCKEEEAEFFGVYLLIKENGMELPNWIADLPTKESADDFAALVYNLKKSLTK